MSFCSGTIQPPAFLVTDFIVLASFNLQNAVNFSKTPNAGRHACSLQHRSREAAPVSVKICNGWLLQKT